jgi:carbon storage regulator
MPRLSPGFAPFFYSACFATRSEDSLRFPYGEYQKEATAGQRRGLGPGLRGGFLESADKRSKIADAAVASFFSCGRLGACVSCPGVTLGVRVFLWLDVPQGCGQAERTSATAFDSPASSVDIQACIACCDASTVRATPAVFSVAAGVAGFYLITEGFKMLVLSRKKSEKVRISEDIIVTLIEIRGDKVRLGIEAPKCIPVHREEVYQAIAEGKLNKLEDRLDCAENQTREEADEPCFGTA